MGSMQKVKTYEWFDERDMRNVTHRIRDVLVQEAFSCTTPSQGKAPSYVIAITFPQHNGHSNEIPAVEPKDV
ncbi:MAG: hypothetical protein NVSMB46_03600 [Candidatus Saccharimonadales bacterium]